MQKRTSDDRFYELEEQSSNIATAIGILIVILMVFVVMAMACNWVHSFSNVPLSIIFQQL